MNRCFKNHYSMTMALKMKYIMFIKITGWPTSDAHLVVPSAQSPGRETEGFEPTLGWR